MSSVLILPACYSLPKVDVIRLVDDFAGDAGLGAPTWSAFGPWTCDPLIDRGQASDAGQDAGLDGGDDAGQGGIGGGTEVGQAASCILGPGPGDEMDDTALLPGVVTRALIASFSVSAPSGVEVATQTKSATSDGGSDALAPSTPVDLTAFTELRFNARLFYTPPGMLPPGTHLRVELHCSYSSMNSPRSERLVYEKFDDVPVGGTLFQPIAFALTKFTGASQPQTCLANVDSIGFIVVPGTAQAGTQIAGELLLDNIRFDNAPPQ